MAKTGYNAFTSADVNFSTVKSLLGIRSGATFGLDLISAWVEFEGIVATGVPVLVELCLATFATNAPGTNSTTETPVQGYGRVLASGMTAARNWVAEPTVLTVLEAHLIHPQSGVIYQLPLGQSYDAGLSEGFVLRGTAAAAVDSRAGFRVERC